MGATRAEATADYDRRLIALLERCHSRGIKLSSGQVQTISLPEVPFIGDVISEDGLQPDPSKTLGVKEIPTPSNNQRFDPILSQITALKRELLKEQNQFVQDDQVRGTSPKLMKEVISASPVLKYFDCKADTEILCESSDKGLSVCLMQGGLPVAYAPRAMTPVEVNYDNIEKELLAIVFGVKRFKQYLQGPPLKIETDHKPLE